MSTSSVVPQIREIKIAHSPDSDDAFMFYGLATNKVRVPGLSSATRSPILKPSIAKPWMAFMT